MKIALITQWYDPEPGSAMTFGVIARALVGAGHEVHVLTGFPNYPTGRVHSGYRLRPYLRETLQGVHVHRAPLYPSHDARASRRALNYTSFAVGASAVGAVSLASMDVALVVMSPATSVVPAMLLRRLGVPYVLHVHDLWPDSALSSGMVEGRGRELAARMLHRLCDAGYRKAEYVAVTSPGMADVLESRGVAAGKLAFVPNWANESLFRNRLATRDARDGTVLMYAGAVGEVQGLQHAVAAMARVSEGVQLVIVGEGSAKPGLQRIVEEQRLTNVRFLPSVVPEAVPALMDSADVQVVSLVDHPLFAHTMPSKIANTLAAGKPILAAVIGDAARVVSDSGAGLVVAPGDVGALAEAMNQMSGMDVGDLGRMGTAGRSYYDSNLSQSVVIEALNDLLARAARRC